jgi:nucleoside-diphosphate-sugar epimerase
MTKISILGCGWLGFPLAQSLLANGYEIKGSTTSEEKISILKNIGVEPFLIALSSAKIDGNTAEFLNESEILIIDIPPKLRKVDSESFVGKIQNLIPFIEKSSVKKVIFISSTSVYGEENTVVTEETPTNPDTESGKQLVGTEKLLHKNNHFKTTVVRFGGLIGEDRNPVYSFAGKTNLANPNKPINFIHQQDCIGIILKIIETQTWNETFNAVAPFHPTRAAYYTQKAIEFNLVPPEFVYSASKSGKIISSEKLCQMLEYHFKTENYTLKS